MKIMAQVSFYRGTKEDFRELLKVKPQTADLCSVYMTEDGKLYFIKQEGQDKQMDQERYNENSFEKFIQEGNSKINSKNDLRSIAFDRAERLSAVTAFYCGDTI